MNKNVVMIGVSIGVAWVLASGIDLFDWVGEGWGGGYGFLWYLYLGPVVALLCGISVGALARENRVRTMVSEFVITLTVMVFGFLVLSYVNQLKMQSWVRDAEQSDREFQKQVEENQKSIEAGKWFETPEYRFQYDKEKWDLYIDDGDQKVFVRNRPLRFAHGKDDLSVLGSYISIRSGEGELPVEGIDTEIVLNGKTVFVREEIIEQGEKRKTYVFPSPNDPFELWWFSQYPYIKDSPDSQDFERIMQTVKLK